MPVSLLRERVDAVVSAAQTRVHACATQGPTAQGSAATLQDAIVHSTRDLCPLSTAQMQLDALQALRGAIAPLPELHGEAPAATLERVKAHLDSRALSTAAERDRLQAVHAEQLRKMTEAVLGSDKQRMLDAAVVAGRGVVECVTTLERLRAAAAALMSVADDAFHAGSEAALRAFVAQANPPDAVASKCARLLEGIVAALRDGFGDAAGLAAVTAALHGGASYAQGELQTGPAIPARAQLEPEDESDQGAAAKDDTMVRQGELQHARSVVATGSLCCVRTLACHAPRCSVIVPHSAKSRGCAGYIGSRRAVRATRCLAAPNRGREAAFRRSWKRRNSCALRYVCTAHKRFAAHSRSAARMRGSGRACARRVRQRAWWCLWRRGAPC